jgi:hypothetical protein
MDFIMASVVAGFVGFVFGVLFAKHVVSEAEALKAHVTAELSGVEGRIRAEIVDVRGKIASRVV